MLVATAIYKHRTQAINILTLRFAQRSKNHESDTSTPYDNATCDILLFFPLAPQPLPFLSVLQQAIKLKYLHVARSDEAHFRSKSRAAESSRGNSYTLKQL